MKARCRDFIVSEDGLVFSVVSYVHPKEMVLAFLRFIPLEESLIKAGSTSESFKYLEENFSDYVFYSDCHDAKLQGVPKNKIRRHINPCEFLKKLLKKKDVDAHEEKIKKLAELLSQRSGVPIEKLGVTGSVLVGAHTASSDIDLVVYGLDNFEKVRGVVVECKMPIHNLSVEELRSAYDKRFPTSKELSFEEFCFHEQRKFNSGVFEGKKFDVLYTRDLSEVEGLWGDTRYLRLGAAYFTGKVVDDSLAFDYPAVYVVSGECVLDGESYSVSAIASFTHTYVGQVFKGEKVKASGILEEVDSPNGVYYRLLVGSSREAGGEYIKNAR